jgi:arginine/lysine/ornithine decarboxylase
MAIDFRSDTVTRPTAPMLAFMQKAPLGDDVFGEDPSINELENFSANLFGMESAIFCPSGTMTNQIAIKCHTQPGDEVICDLDSHIYPRLNRRSMLMISINLYPGWLAWRIHPTGAVAVVTTGRKLNKSVLSVRKKD